jgi:hypothetical protein
VLLIIANAYDNPARALSRLCRDEPTLLLTPRDLSREGWQYHVGSIDQGWVVASGTRIRTRDIRGVVTRLAWIDPRELEHIVREEREYVAAEMSAVLLAWISELRCRVVNRPSTTCLCGPGWSIAEWETAAVRAGIAVMRDKARGGDTVPITIAGNEILGPAPADLKGGLVRLAQLAGVEFVTVHLNAREPALERVDLWPDVSDSTTAGALLKLFDVDADQAAKRR